MKGSRRIYVEIRIRGALDTLWERSQNPALHQQWDLRFSRITYAPRPDPAAPQRFHYATRIGFGLAIRGAGETIATQTSDDGTRTSSLKFWSDSRLSLIREGAGFWRYVPTDDGIRFVTAYDYEVRFGAAGRAFDRYVFRPILGWATAYSFDRLRLWVERDVPPSPNLARAYLVRQDIPTARTCLRQPAEEPR